MKERSFWIWERDLKHLLRVIDRDHMELTIKPSPVEGRLEVTGLVPDRVKRDVLDAIACLRQEDEHQKDRIIPVYSLRVLENRNKLERLMRINRTRSYTVLERDRAKFMALGSDNFPGHFVE